MLKNTLLILLFASLNAHSSVEVCQGYGLRSIPAPSSLHTESNLWKVRSPSGDEGIIFGVIHTSNAGILGKYEPLKTIALKSDVYFPEVDLSSSAIDVLTQAGEAETDSGLSHLNPEQLKMLGEILTSRGQALSQLEKKKDWFVFSVIARPMERGYTIDHVLYMFAQAQKKNIVPLESMPELVNSLNTFKYAKETMLDVICSYKEVNAQALAMKQAYIEGQWATLFEEAQRWESVNPQVSKDFSHHLVIERNHNMTKNIIKTLKGNQRFFVSVGLMHLPGQEGLLELLKKQGFSVKPITMNEVTDETAKIEQSILESKVDAFKSLSGAMQVATGYQLESSLALPKVRFITARDLSIQFCSGFSCPIEAFYDEGTIYVATSLLGGIEAEDTWTMSLILRELTHWAQEKDGKRFPQPWCESFRERELEAHLAQSYYLREKGLPQPPIRMNPPPPKCRRP